MTLRQEKRRVPRVPVSMKIEAGDTLGFGYVRNLSEEGMAVDAAALAIDQFLPLVGHELQLRFKLPHSNLVIAVTGKVVRVEHHHATPRLGVMFQHTTPEIRTEIQCYVKGKLSPSSLRVDDHT